MESLNQYSPDYPQQDQSQSDAFPILDYLQLLWFRRKLILAITLLVSAVGYIQVNQLRSVYTASSTMLIGVHQKTAADIAGTAYYKPDYTDPTKEVEILKSRGLAERVITKLNLLNQAEFNPSLVAPQESFFDFLKYLNPKTWIPDSWTAALREGRSGEVVSVPATEEEKAQAKLARAVDIFLGKLKAEPVQYSDVITVSFSSLDPGLAARIANEIPESYIVDTLEAKFEATQKVTDWLADQLEQLKIKVADSERAVEIYSQEHNLTETAGTGLLAEQLSEINSQLIIARAARAEAEVRLDQMTRISQTSKQDLETSTDVISSPQIQRLRTQETEAMRRKSEMAVVYGPKHPLMLQVNAEIDDLNRRIGDEIDKIAVGLKNEVERAQLREQSLASSLARLSDQSGVQNQEAVQLRALQREAAANRVLFENFLGRFKETSSTEGMEAANARIISRAETPTIPSYPNRKRMMTMYVLLGLMGACGLVLGLQYLNPGIYTPEQIQHDLGVHAIGMIPKLPPKVEPHEYLLDKPGSNFMEAINSIVVSLRLSDPDKNVKTMQVTSSVPEEGKSTLVLSLAIAMAKSGKRVLLMDTDLRRSSLEERLGFDSKVPGLTDLVMAESDNVSDYISRHEPSGIDFMRSGKGEYASASEIFSSRRMQKIIDLLKQQYDYILLDSPPVMAVSDARVIGQLVDKTLFVIRWDKTPKKAVKAAIQLLRQGGTEVGGIVLQQVDLKRYGRIGYGDSGYYYHYGRYSQYYSS